MNNILMITFISGNIMTLSYSIGLTTGSGVAYLIDFFLGPPLLHPCFEPFASDTMPASDNMTSLPLNITFSDLLWNITIPLNNTGTNT
ncbi:hypothetical protein X975_01112, partial [Stegodyphus mimosarum]